MKQSVAVLGRSLLQNGGEINQLTFVSWVGFAWGGRLGETVGYCVFWGWKVG